MEFETMVQERIESLEREVAEGRQLAEAKRVGAIQLSGPRVWVDTWLIRASKGAERRQAKRFSHDRRAAS